MPIDLRWKRSRILPLNIELINLTTITLVRIIEIWNWTIDDLISELYARP